MDKGDFLKELETYLAVLNESEQKDILDEYAQHIDMKMEKGMSEAEAIGDFGAIGELAAEILEAYHVNPQFGAERNADTSSSGEWIHRPDFSRERVRNLRSRLWTRFNQVGAHLWRWVTFCVSGILFLARAPIRWFNGLWTRWQMRRQNQLAEADSSKEDFKEDGVVRRSDISRQVDFPKVIAKKAVGGMSQMIAGICSIILWCARWTWNFMMFIVILTTGGLALTGLFLFGLFVILLAQGYPFIGIVIGCLGATISSVAITLFAIGFLRLKVTEKKDTDSQSYFKEDIDSIGEVAEHA